MTNLLDATIDTLFNPNPYAPANTSPNGTPLEFAVSLQPVAHRDDWEIQACFRYRADAMRFARLLSNLDSHNRRYRAKGSNRDDDICITYRSGEEEE